MTFTADSAWGKQDPDEPTGFISQPFGYHPKTG